MPLACQDALNPDFLALMGERASALPPPNSSVVILVANQTIWTTQLDLSVTYRAAQGADWLIGMPEESYLPIVFECGVTDFTINGADVFTSTGTQTANFPGGPLDEGVDFICGAVIKIFIYPTVDASGNPIYEIASETVLD
jgi:hypothetical protein